MIPTLFHRVTGHRKSESNMGRNRVVVYPDWCKGCGICAAFCPKKVFAVGQDGKARVVNEEACVNCGFCEPHCPDFAVLVIPGHIIGRIKATGVDERRATHPDPRGKW